MSPAVEIDREIKHPPCASTPLRVSRLPAELTVLVPTYNERENVSPLVAALTMALDGLEWEVMFVDDDSPDGTGECIRKMSRENPRVRLYERYSRRGLSSACIDGMLVTSAPYLVVMDGDLQHDERIVPEMLRRMKSEPLDIVVGSRMVCGGTMGELSRNRVLLTTFGSHLSHIVCGYDISDPLSGFFMLRRTFFERAVSSLKGKGFKILFDLLTSSASPDGVAEIPYHFRNRQWGQSKLSFRVELDYLKLLAERFLRLGISRHHRAA
jgi:dolichol-phosphate mannosyltransferase